MVFWWCFVGSLMVFCGWFNGAYGGVSLMLLVVFCGWFNGVFAGVLWVV